ncbi:MAG: hypothetical protein ACE5JC_07300 [Candidatus Zixiibacteriota bacterium]
MSLIRARIASDFYDRPEVIFKIADSLFIDMFSSPVDGQGYNPDRAGSKSPRQPPLAYPT